MATAVTVQFTQAQIVWRAFRSRDNSACWVAICDPLKLTAQGDSWVDLMNACAEAVQLLLTDLHVEGDLDAFLRERGWMPVAGIPAPTQPVKFDIPVEILLRNANGDRREAV